MKNSEVVALLLAALLVASCESGPNAGRDGGATSGGGSAATGGGATTGGGAATGGGASTGGGAVAGGGAATGGGTVTGGGSASDAGLIFFDDFNYALERLDTGSTKLTVAMNHGYTGIKDEQTNPGGALGFLYTVTSIEGDTSGIPGGGRAMALETRANTYQGQPAYHLQLGSGMVGAFPANLWIQFWMYVQDDAASSKRSVIVGRNKFIYPLLGSRPGYPTATEDVSWLMGFRPDAVDIAQGTTISQPNPAALVFETRGVSSGATGPRAFHPHLMGTGLEDYQYPNLNVPTNNDRFILPNRWYLVRFHFDMSGAVDSDTSVYEAWWREKGAQAGGLVKRCEYIGGQAAPGSPMFSFHNRRLDNQGAKAISIPTTVGSVAPPWGDSWIYLKDLTLAGDSSQLPTYTMY